MKLDIARLSQERELVLQEEWDPIEFDLNAAGLEFSGLLKVSARIKKDGGLIVARVGLDGETRLTCSRCARVSPSSLSHSFRLAYPISAAETQLVLDEHIREELILAYPAKMLCRQDCSGLCPRCGADLNNEKCRCKVP